MITLNWEDLGMPRGLTVMELRRGMSIKMLMILFKAIDSRFHYVIDREGV